jgi:hypothetical protein
MLLYSHIIPPRLKYITDFIENEISGISIQLTSSFEKFKKSQGPKINYSREITGDSEFFLQAHSLLFENDIKPQEIKVFEINNNKAFFKTEGDFPFDIFAASFYLLSRYEEYLPHTKDIYDRYAHENSIAFKENFLHLPLINIWLRDFKNLLQQKFPSLLSLDSRLRTSDSRLPTPDSELPIPDSRLTFLPTYDIDIAWSYKHKGWKRNLGGMLRSLFKGHWWQVKERIKVLGAKQNDPFDAFSWMNELHEKYKLQPYYFFLVADKTGRYDKNILPGCKAMEQLIKDHARRYPVGIHPSWRSGDDDALLNKEIDTLANITGNKIASSRQHFIRFTLPQSFRRLIDHGIRNDFSMGYGSINGFRASVASPFYWYDLEKEEQTELLLFPFCYMDANSFYEQKNSAQQALEEMRHYYHAVESVNGHFIMIWHNSFLGTDRQCAGWRNVYEQFIKETQKLIS